MPLGFRWLNLLKSHARSMNASPLQGNLFAIISGNPQNKLPTKTCQLCKEAKPLIAFPNQPRNKDNLDSRCRTCIRQHTSLRARLKRQFPAPPPGLCPICSRHTKEWVLDHCHTTDKFRGYICRSCNLGLGHFDDSPAMVKTALDYLLGINT